MTSWLARTAGRAAGGSLHRQLLLWLLLPQFVLWLAAAFVTYNLAARYANRATDAGLLQASRSLARQIKPIGYGLLIDFPRAAQDIIEADPEDRALYMVSTPPGQFILGNRKLPLPPADLAAPPAGEPLFYDTELDGQRLRVAAITVRIGEADATQTMMVQIARNRAGRDELARRILVDTVLPLSALIALMTMVVWAGIRAGLAPLARLTAQVENRAPNDLAPLEPKSAPQEVRALAAALNQLLGAVQEGVVAQRRFLANAAHQLRTPLAGLKSQTELALQSNRDPALAARLERVHESAVRSAHLVHQIMALARAEPEAAGALQRAPLDLRALAAGVAAEQVPRALQAGVDLGFDASSEPAAPVMVLGNEALLREAVLNLVDNAIRYAGAGAEITLAVRVREQRAWLEVSDNGGGVPPDQLDAIFDRFRRATHEGTGCGLGLAIVREIATRHGGTAQAFAATPHGLCVRIDLPIGPTKH